MPHIFKIVAVVVYLALTKLDIHLCSRCLILPLGGIFPTVEWCHFPRNTESKKSELFHFLGNIQFMLNLFHLF